MGEVFHYEINMFVFMFVLVLVLSEKVLVLVIERYAIHSNQELKIKLV